MDAHFNVLVRSVVAIGFITASASAQTTINVELTNSNEFLPADITINVGDTVHWFWTGGFHSVESGIIVNSAGVPDGRFRSGGPTDTPGTTFDLTFDQAFLDAQPAPNNVYDYYCVVHANLDMAGTVTVQQQAPECTQDSDCQDADVCNGSETCQSTACVAGTALDCDDGIACTADSCDAAAGCQNVADDAACNDDNGCTDDVCNAQDGCQNRSSCDGACCFISGVCADETIAEECKLVGGSYLGDNQSCTGDPDQDGAFGCADGCPSDPEKVEPGVCGCGTPDHDLDNDGVIDCIDSCLDTPIGLPVDEQGCGKIGACCFRAGVCFDDLLEADCTTIEGVYQGDRTECESECIFPGSGDVDNDGMIGIADFAFWQGCETGPDASSFPESCDELDIDGDLDLDLRDFANFQRRFLRCKDVTNCNNGGDICTMVVCDSICVFPAIDSDDDGVGDCDDGCPFDPNKIDAGFCGCGQSDIDSDNDLVLDCVDECPDDPEKVVKGICGCSIPDEDLDCNGIADCQEVTSVTSERSIDGSSTNGASLPFTFLQTGFIQELYGTAPGFMAGIAFAPDGDVLVTDCGTSGSGSGGTIRRFDAQSTTTINGSTVHTFLGADSSNVGCGITNHPDGTLYSNTVDGVSNLSPADGSELRDLLGAAGNALGITVDPRTLGIVYVGATCPFFGTEKTCTIYSLDTTDGSVTTYSSLDATDVAGVDGILFDPSGEFLFMATRVPGTTMTILDRTGAIVQNISLSSEATSIAFHGLDGFVLTVNTDGTLTRLDFPGNNYNLTPIQSLFADGGFRGQGSHVGADGCFYLTQDGTRFADGTESGDNSVVRICGGFHSPLALQLELTPDSAIRVVRDVHTVSVVFSTRGTPISGADVTFDVFSGPNMGIDGIGTTDSSGGASFSYVGSDIAGVDQIRAMAEHKGDTGFSKTVTVSWCAK